MQNAHSQKLFSILFSAVQMHEYAHNMKVVTISEERFYQ
jgi:hypothetical protein